MSEIEDRIVRMKFDNAQFEQGVSKTLGTLKNFENALKMDGASNGLQTLQATANKFSLNSIGESVQAISGHFTWLGRTWDRIVDGMTSKALHFGKDLLNKVTMKPLIDGFSEYQTQMKSIQTISANTGLRGNEGIGKINDALDELNEYADKTIYNFSEMTRNIGTFTAAGVDLDTSVNSIQGIANLAAMSGSTSQQASTAMYQLSQAIASGTVKLQDWNSVVNAGMGGQVFQDALKRTARAHGIAVDEMIEKTGSFRESLKEGWITSEVLTDTLTQLTMTTEGLTKEEIDRAKAELVAQGYSEKDAQAILDLADASQEAATKVRTWTQLWETVGEALGSGWAQSWRIIVGDFNEATELFTFLSDTISGVVSASSESRNAILQQWHDLGGREDLFGALINVIKAIEVPLSAVSDSFKRVFSFDGADLESITHAFAVFTEKLVMSEEQANKVGEVAEGIFLIFRTGGSILGKTFGIVVKIVSKVWDLLSPVEEGVGDFAQGTLDFLVGALIKVDDALTNSGESIDKFLGFVESAFNTVAELWNSNPLVQTVGGWLSDVSSKLMGWANPFVEGSEEFNKAIEGTTVSLEDWNRLVSQGLGGKETQEALKRVAKEHGVEVDALIEKYGSFRGSIESGWISAEIFNEAMAQVSAKTKASGDSANKTSDEIKKLTDKILSGKAGLKDFKAALKLLPAPIKNAGKAVKDFSKKTKDFGTNVYKQAKEYVKGTGLIEKAKSAFTIDGLKQIGKDLITTIGNVFEYFKTHNPKTIVEDLSKVLNGDTFKGFIENIKSISPTIGNGLESLVSGILEKMQEFTGGMESYGDLLPGIFQGLKENISNLPSILASGLSGLGDVVSDVIKGAFEIGGGAQDGAGKVMDTIKSLLPTPESIGTLISDTFSGMTGSISSGIKSLFSNKESMDALKAEAVDFSGFDLKLPDLKTPLKKAFEDFGEVLDAFPEDKLNHVFERLGYYFSRLATGAWIFQAWRFVGALSSIGRGIGSTGKGLGEFMGGLNETIGKAFSSFGQGFKFKEMGEAIRDGLKNIGSGTLIFKKQTKAQAFQRIASGIILLAGAFGIVMKTMEGHSYEEAMNVAKIIVALGGAMGAIAVIIGSLGEMSKADFQGVANSMAGMGVGILAAVVSLVLITEYFKRQSPEEMEKGLIGFAGVVGAVSLIGASMKNVSFAGMAAGLLGLSVALLLMLIPIKVLSKMDYAEASFGVGMVGLLAIVFGAVIGLATRIGQYGHVIKGFGPAAIGLGVALTLLAIPIKILAKLMSENPVAAFAAEAYILGMSIVFGAVIALATQYSGSTAELWAFGATAIALAAALTILAIPITAITLLINKFGWDVAGAMVVISGMAVVMGGTVALASKYSGSTTQILALGATAIAMSIAMMAMTVALAALSLVAKLNPEGLIGAVVAVGVIIAAFSSLASTAGSGNPVSLLAMAGSIIAFSLSIGLMATAFKMLETVNMEAIGGQLIAVAGGLAVFAIAAAVASATGIAIGMLAVGAAVLAFGAGCLSAAAGIYLFAQTLQQLGATAPEDFARIGSGLGEGLASAIGSFGITMFQKGGELIAFVGSGILNAIPNALNAAKEAAGKILDVFTGNSAEAENAGKEVIDNVSRGTDGSVSDLRSKLNKHVNESVMNIGPEAKSSGNQVGAEIVKGEAEGIENSSGEAEGAMQTATDGVVNAATEGLGDLKNLVPAEAQEAMEQYGISIENYDLSGAVDGKTDELLAQWNNGLQTGMGESGQIGLDAFTEGIANADVSGIGDQYMNQITGSLAGLPDQMGAVGNDATQGLFNGMTSETSLSQLTQAGMQQGQTAEQGLRDQTETNSPSEKFRVIGTNLADGLVLGMNESDPKIQAAGAKMGRSVLTGLTKALNNARLSQGTFRGLLNSMSSAMSESSAIMNRTGRNVVTALSNAIAANAGRVKAPAKSMQTNIISALSQLPTQTRARGVAAVTSFITGMTSMASRVSSAASTLAKRASEGLKTVSKLASTAGASGGTSFATGLSGKGSSAHTAGSGLAASAKRGLESVGAWQVGADFGQGFINGMSSKGSAISDMAWSLGRKAVESLKKATGSHSPSREAMKVGNYTGQGFIIGMDQYQKAVSKAGETMGVKAIDSIADSISRLQINDLVDTSYSPVITPVIDSTTFDQSMDQLMTLRDMNIGSMSMSGVLDGSTLSFSQLASIETSNRELIGEIQLLRAELQQWTEVAANSNIVMDSGELVGALAPAMDSALGQRQTFAQRGMY